MKQITKNTKLKENHALKAAEITTDVVVKFTHFLYKYRIEFDGFSKQGDLYDITGKSEKELFQEFINNHYTK